MKTGNALVFLLAIARSNPAVAHDHHAHLTSLPWTADPWILVPLGLIAILYGCGNIRFRPRSAASRVAFARRSLTFWTGWLVLASALVSPLHWLGEQLFTVHMIEHELVMAVSAPLLVLARPSAVLLWGLPKTIRRRTGGALAANGVRRTWAFLSNGTITTLLHGMAIWAWHAPVLFDAAVEYTSLHRLQHLCFFSTAILFWWSVFWKTNRGLAALHLFVTMLHMSILGALIALSPNVLYGLQTRVSGDWGLLPLEDQQMAGLVMWVPAGVIYAAVALALTALWIRDSGKGGASGTRIVAP
ncbi:putative membrane protein [Rhizobium leguminosarum bv. trifolii WSM2297]|uniref:Putative membrane protein n=1 Tax=Rhizobium leguminosarum bv. trifolii WSM2297 TaxID=754762 RepID=J0WG29_RHILT|nr:cytochrome c oxidase assembly protein [Rhizobium leguminosarum]EJC84041.1 putative membrane protein [Rhizobium leguminosarum bv. trifolii WSM2297]EJC84368.1 putative membrane protein [Rhizobium leguminosarum bv. trifolii WSM2297]